MTKFYVLRYQFGKRYRYVFKKTKKEVDDYMHVFPDRKYQILSGKGTKRDIVVDSKQLELNLGDL